MKSNYINPTYKALVLFCLTLLFTCTALSQEFSTLYSATGTGVDKPRFNEIINGDFTTIANTSVSAFPTNRAYTQPIDFNDDSIDNQYVDYDPNVSTPPPYTTYDADGTVRYKMDYVDIDENPRTFNSSSATFKNPMPSSSCLTIKKVYLYWSASNMPKNFNPFSNPNNTEENEPDWDFDTVLLMMPGETDYTRQIKADEIIYDGRVDKTSNDPYTCISDITKYVNDLSSPFGKYQVANIEAKTGLTYSHIIDNGQYIKTGAAAGWQIVFVYEDANLPKRSISIYDGYSQIVQGKFSQYLEFKGFTTVPKGDVNANILFGALEGDKNINNSTLGIQPDGSSFYTAINNGTVRKSTNFFNSSVTLNDAIFTDRVPKSTNTLGFDAGVFKLDNSTKIIGNNQSSVSMRLSTTGDSYGVYLIGFSIEVYQPELGPLVLNSDVVEGENVTPDQIITNTLTLKNRGNDDAKDVKIATTISPQVELIEPIIGLPSGVTYTYDALTKILVFSIPDALVKAKGVKNLALNYKTQVKNECYFLTDNCSLNFTPKAVATYTGTNNSTQQTTESHDNKDGCNNGSTTSRTYQITPSKSVWTTVKDALNVELECSDMSGLNDAQNLKPKTNCPALDAILVKTSGDFVVDTATGCASKGTYTNTWTFKDACGNVPSEAFTQVITVVDNTKPDLSSCGGKILELTLECGNPNNKTIAENWNSTNLTTIKGCVTDNCDTNIANNITSDYNFLNITEPSCKDEDKSIPITYTIKDECGNESTLVTKIIYTDTTGPSLDLCNSIETETTEECDGTDLVTKVEAWHNANMQKLKNCAEDACSPTDAPTLFSTYDAVNIVTSCGKGGSIEVEYYAKDKCGNESERIKAKFIVEDTKLPEVTSCVSLDKATECNANATEAEADQWNADNLIALKACATDSCSPSANLTISSDYDFDNRIASPKCANGGSLVVTYTIKDECGNTAEVKGKFSYGDGIPPNLDSCMLNDLTLECGKYTKADVDAWYNSIISAINTCAKDDCEKDFVPNIKDDYNFSAINPAECGSDGGITEVNFSVSDKCDNTTVKTLKIIVKDNTAPDLTLCNDKLKDLTLECGEENKAIADQWNQNNIEAIKTCATDACLSVDSNILSDYKFGNILPAECGDDGSKTVVTYTVKDICGNEATISVNIILKDTKGPDLSLCNDKLNDITIECGEDYKDKLEQWNTDNIAQIKTCATDACLSVDANITSNYKFEDIKPAECGDDGAKTPVTYTVKDICGNESTITVNIVLKDTTGPDLSLCNDKLNDITIECGKDYKDKLEQWNTDNIAQIKTCATDTCLSVDANITSNYKFEDIKPAECGDDGAKTPVTYTVKDICGNESTITVNIILKDTEGPDLTLCNDKLSDITVECGEDYKNKLEQWNTNNIAQIKTCATDACVTVDANITSNYKFEDIKPAECGDDGAKTPVTYTVKDICGNESTIVVNIILKDTKGPDLSLCNDKLNDITVECGEDYKDKLEQWNTDNIAEIKACATDACVTVDSNITSSYKFEDIKPAECGDEGGKTPVTYTVKDICGNESTIVVNIILKDTKGPDLTLCNDKLNDITIECGEDYKDKLEQWNTDNIAQIKTCATDACVTVDADITSNYKFEDIKPAECGDEGAKTPVTYTVKDICGNESTIVVNIILKDTKGPDLTLCNDKLSDITIECGEDYKDKLEQWNADNMAQIKTCATDACVSVDANITSNYDITAIKPVECGKGSTTPVTYTVKDICGNESTIDVNIILKDTTGPDLSACKVLDKSTECTADATEEEAIKWNAENIEALQSCAKDDCDPDYKAEITSDFDFANFKPSDCGNGGTLIVTYFVKDKCGNTSEIKGTYASGDSSPPDVSTCQLNDITLECGEYTQQDVDTWHENIVNTFKTCASDVCETDFKPIVSDDYDFTKIKPAECGEEGAKTPVTFTIKDKCDNATTKVVYIIVKDTKGPDLTLCNDKLNDITVECGEDYKDKLEQWNAANMAQIKTCATDACVSVDANITSNYDITAIKPVECGKGSTTPVTYTVKDICGNESTVAVNIILKDTKGPDLSACKVLNKSTECTADATEEDAKQWNAENIEALQSCAKDDCNPDYKAEVTSDFDFANFKPSDCGNGGTLTVTYFVKDICGNTSEIKGTYASGDSSPPDVSTCQLNDITLECGEYTQQDLDAWYKNTISALKTCAVDACEADFKPIVSDDYDFTKIKPAECGEEGAKTPVTFTIKDKCDNATTKVVYIIVKDTKGPDLTLCNDKISDITIECGKDYKDKLEQWNAANMAQIKTCATDACVAVDADITSNYKFEDIKPAECGDDGSKTQVTYTVKDICGNATTVTANIILKDTTGPDLTLCNDKLSDITVECGEDYKDKLEQWNSDNIAQIKACATDACVEVDQNIGSNYKFEDVIPVECGSDGAKTPITYTVTDICGNKSSVTVNIILKDTKGPDLTLCSKNIKDITVECGEDYKDKLEQWNKANISQIQACATDACVAVDQNISSNYKFEDIKPAQCDANGAKTPVTYTVKDICGNSTTITANIILKDTKGPDLSVCTSIKDLVLECGSSSESIADQWNKANIAAIKTCATDACLTVDVNNIGSTYKFSDVAPADCATGSITPVEYTVSDICGNQTKVKVNIIFKDTKAPVIKSGQTSVSVLCSDLPDVPKLEFEDACNNIVKVIKFEEENTKTDDVSNYTVTRKWYVSDECGNDANYTQTISVQFQNFEFDNDGEHCTDDGEINLFDYAQGHKDLTGQWIFVDGPEGQEIKINNGIFDPKDFKLGEYEFYYTSPQGACYRTTNLKIILNDECIPLPCGLEDFTISKAITPNGDMYNEYFEVKGTRECGFKLKLKIFNRWGSMIYESEDYKNDWNGFTHSSSVGNNGKVPNGTYFYILDIVNSGIKPVSGPIYIGTK